MLFRRGEQALGLFIVFRGKVSLDLGVNSVRSRYYGPGALLGLPATITRRNYSMTATVAEDTELGFWNAEALETLLRKRPALCPQLLSLLEEKMTEILGTDRPSIARQDDGSKTVNHLNAVL